MRELSILLPYLRRYRATYLLGIALVLVSNAFTTMGPRFLERGIDEIGRGAPLSAVIWSAVVLVAVAVVGGIGRFGMRQLLNSGSRRIETEMRDDLYFHLLRQSASFYDSHPTGDLIARATNDLTAVRMVAGPALMYLVDTVVRAGFIVPQMAHINLPLTGLALLPLVGITAVMIVLGRVVHERSLAIQEHFGTISAYVQEHLSGVRVVRAYRQERAEERHFGELNDEYLRRNVAMARVQGVFHALMPLLGGIGGVIVLYIGGRLVIAGTISAGAFVAFSVYLAMLVWPMIALGWAINLFQRGAASVKRITEIHRAAPAILSPEVPVPLPPSSGARSVTFEHVSFRYPSRSSSWGPRVPASPPPPSCSGVRSIRTAVASSSTAWTSARSRWACCGRPWAWCRRRPSSSPTRCATTCSWAPRTTAGWNAWPPWRSWTRRSPTCRTATTPCWASGA